MLYDEDDDAPPPLSSLADQVSALSYHEPAASTSQRAALDDDTIDLPIASTTIAGSGGPMKQGIKPVPVLKKGFFDSKPSSSSTGHKSKEKGSQPPIAELKGRPGGGIKGPIIPDFLRVEPDEDAKRLQEVKGKLVEALKPTPELMSHVASDPRLMAGFDDPEVMAAIDEISKDPSKMTKYKDNRKVAEFYKAMSSVLGNQLEKMENKPL